MQAHCRIVAILLVAAFSFTARAENVAHDIQVNGQAYQITCSNTPDGIWEGDYTLAAKGGKASEKFSGTIVYNGDTDPCGDFGYSVADWNFDGYDDVIIHTGQGSGYGAIETYKLYLYEAGQKELSQPVQLTNAYRCPASKEILNTGNDMVIISANHYRWKNNRLYLLRSETEYHNLINDPAKPAEEKLKNALKQALDFDTTNNTAHPLYRLLSQDLPQEAAILRTVSNAKKTTYEVVPDSAYTDAAREPICIAYLPMQGTEPDWIILHGDKQSCAPLQPSINSDDLMWNRMEALTAGCHGVREP